MAAVVVAAAWVAWATWGCKLRLLRLSFDTKRAGRDAGPFCFCVNTIMICQQKAHKIFPVAGVELAN
jgi:hypothetical protein